MLRGSPSGGVGKAGRKEDSKLIADTLRNSARYRSLGDRISSALSLLVENDFETMELGKHEVDSVSLFYSVQSYTTKPRGQGAWESHRKYIDVQYIVEGIERIGWAPISVLSVIKPYDAEIDASLYEGDGDFIVARQGTFLVLWPEDAHMPGIAVTDPRQVRKVVVKVLL